MDVQLVQEGAVNPRSERESVTPVGRPASLLLQGHMPGLDVLRGVAVMLVVLFHGFAYQAPNVRWGSRQADMVYGLTGWGWLGVNLFFVISGFLITGILDDTVHLQNFYRRFYLRRALRILPAYLAILALAWAAGFITPNYIAICLLFLANMPGLFLHHGYLFYGPFWSLAVEEQFYLFWPLLYRRVKRRGMLAISLALLLVCPVLRALAFAHLVHTGDALSKTWMIADNLAIGAVLAILLRWPGVTIKQFVTVAWIQLVLGVSGLATLFALHRMQPLDVLRNSIGLSCFQLVCGSALVAMVCLFRARSLPRWLGIFVFFGNISYGLYLVHLLFLQIYDRVWGAGFATSWELLLSRFVIANGAAIAVAVLSKRFFEDPILSLKSRLREAN